MNFKKYYLLLAFLCSQFVVAQDAIPIFADYLSDNLYLIHPSTAGLSTKTKVRITGRRQWFDVDDAPNLTTASINGRVGEKVGLGGILFADTNGFFSQRGAFATFAYHILLGRNYVDLNQLSFGISAGIIQSELDQSQFDPEDPAIGTTNTQSDSFLNIDFGVTYSFLNFVAHATVKNVLPAERDIFTPQFEPDNQRRFLLSAAYVFGKFYSDWSFEPSVLFQLIDQTQEASVDVNFKTFYETDWGKLWGGLSYRRSLDGAEFTTNGIGINTQRFQSITPFLGIDYNQFLFAYTYSNQINEVVISNAGFHQLTLGYNFGTRRDPYDCKCPAVN